MLNRFLEVMTMAMLLVLTIGTTFQVLNFQMLRDIQQAIKSDRATPIVVESPPPQFLQLPSAPAAAPQGQVPQPPAPPVVKEPQPAPAIPVKPIAAAPSVPDTPEPQVPTATAPTPPPEKPAAAPPAQWKEYEPHVMRLITQLFEGKYDDAYLRFTPRFAEKLTQGDLAAAMDDVRKLHGGLDKFVQVTAPEGLQPPNAHTFRVRISTTASSLLQFSVTMTPDKTVDGLLFIEVAGP